jgi:hypothetical protein
MGDQFIEFSKAKYKREREKRERVGVAKNCLFGDQDSRLVDYSSSFHSDDVIYFFMG